MVWSKHERTEEHAKRSDALTAAYHGPSGLTFAGNATNRNGAGSRGGAPIWVMREAWGLDGEKDNDNDIQANTDTGHQGMASDCPTNESDPIPWRGGIRSTVARFEILERERTTTLEQAKVRPPRKGSWKKIDPTSNYDRREARENGDGHGADPDGFAVFGRYPKGFLAHVVKAQILGADIRRDNILHVCSGTLSEHERWTVDIRAEARPWVQASGTALPFRDGAFRAVMLDPPYSDEYARNLYKVENPRPSWLLKEAVRVVAPGGRVGILHVAVPFAPPGCRLVTVHGVSTGVGFRIRAFTVYEKDQAELW